MTASHDGVVLQGTGGVWQVRADDGVTYATSLRGRLKHDARGAVDTDRMKRAAPRDHADRTLKLAVGDRVTITAGEDASWAIDAIHPRTSKLARRAPGGAIGERVVVANLDQVLVVFAAANPEPHVRMLDRFLVIAEANDVRPRVIVNKCELVPERDIRERFADYTRAGYDVHLTSVKQRTGLEELRAQIIGRSSALCGPSGVGKSSMMNALFPGLDLRTAEISASVNKGRHTTVGAVLHPLPDGGYVADTPGLREVGLWGITSRDMVHCFPELRLYDGQCRFGNCTHRAEPGCAMREALARGDVSEGRYGSFLTLRDELADASAGQW